MTQVAGNKVGGRSHGFSMNLRHLMSNQAPAHYWAMSGCDDNETLKVCTELDTEWMFALITFGGDGKINFSVSQKTWQRQEGHFPTILQIFTVLATDPRLQELKGSVIVWLEDGMWDWCQEYSARAPILAFGRNKNDCHTVLIPDPAFLGALGYLQERQQTELLGRQSAWNARAETIFWRGAATGIGIEGPSWVNTARGKLVLKAKEIGEPSIVDAKLTRLKHLTPEVVELIEGAGVVDAEVPFDRFFHYKYVVDADGYHCAWMSLFLKLMMGSTVLKIDSPFEQWYHQGLVPWRHYVPLSSDLRELVEVHRWLKAHDQEAHLIARQATEFIQGVDLESTLYDMVTVLEHLLTCQVSA